MAWLNVKGKSNLTDAVGREKAKERTRERSVRSPRCGTDGGLIGIRIPFVGGKENGCRGKTRLGRPGRKEGRKVGRQEGRRREGTIWHDGKSNQRGKNPGIFHGRQGEITCIWRQLSSGRFDFDRLSRSACKSSLVDQSFPSKPKRDLPGVVAPVATIKKHCKAS